MIFIPAIDLIEGKCVRLRQGSYTQVTRYAENPVDVALTFQDQGAKYLHIVDLDAAKDVREGNIQVIKNIIRAVRIPAEVGGGVRSRDKINLLLTSGADRVIIGTIIVKDPNYVQELISEFGEGLVAGIDAKGGMVRVSGWTEESGIEATDLGKRAKEMGFALIIYTDIAMDGTLKGPNIQGIRKMAEETGLPVIAAGGIKNLDDVRKVTQLENYGVIGVISGRAVYEGTLSVREVCSILEKSGG